MYMHMCIDIYVYVNADLHVYMLCTCIIIRMPMHINVYVIMYLHISKAVYHKCVLRVSFCALHCEKSASVESCRINLNLLSYLSVLQGSLWFFLLKGPRSPTLAFR